MNGEFDGLMEMTGEAPEAKPLCLEDVRHLKDYEPAPPHVILTGLVVHCDGSVSVKHNPSGDEAAYGFAVYGHVGSLDGHGWVNITEGWGPVPKEHGTTTNVGEYYAVIAALEKVIELNYRDLPVEIRSDSQLIIRQINGDYAVTKPHLLKLWQKVEDLKAALPRAKFVWVPREQNKYADELAGRTWKERR